MSSDIGPDEGFESELKKLKRSYNQSSLSDSDEIQSQDEDSDYANEREARSSHKKSNSSSRGKSKTSYRSSDDDRSIESENNAYSDEDYGDKVKSGDFIADDEAELAEAEQLALRSHRRYSDLPRDREEEDVEEIAARLKSRYENYGSKKSFVSTAEHIPKQFLLPGVQDPHLFMIRCAMGKERDVVFQLMRRCVEKVEAGQRNTILSAYCRNGLPGYVYLEANSHADAQASLERTAGIINTKLLLVPIDQMVDVIRVKKKDVTIQPGAWVRVKRGKYAGDLAQVLAIIDSTDSAELKLVPRIEYDEIVNENGKKKKSLNSQGQIARAPQKLFDPREAERIDMNKPVIPRGSEIFHWGGEIFNKGYLEKEFKLVSLQTEKVNPTLEEITTFSGGDSEALVEAAVAAAAASSLVDSNDKNGNEVLDVVIGDNVEVIEGDLVGVSGTVTGIENDGILRVRLSMDKLLSNNQKNRGNTVMSFRSRQLKKLFREGDHVKVLRGNHDGVTGTVVSVDGIIVTLVSDLSLSEIKVFARDICQSEDVSKSTESGEFAENELVSIDGGRNVAIILASEKGLYKVLDQNGEVSTIKSYETTKPRHNNNFNVVYDSNRNELKVGDIVREINGGNRSGTIVQLSRFVAFIRSDSLSENGGMFASRVRNLASATPSRDSLNPFGNQKVTAKKFRPPSNFFRGRDQAKGKVVIVIRGSFKGYMGVVKESTGSMARVEIHSSAKVINVERDKLAIKLPDGRTMPLDFNPPGNEGSGRADFNGNGRPNSRFNNRGNGSSPFPNTPSNFPSTPGNNNSFGSSWGDSSATAQTPSSNWGGGGGITESSENNSFSGGWNSNPSSNNDSSNSWGSETIPETPSNKAWGSNSTPKKLSNQAWGSESSTSKPSDNTWGSDSSTTKPSDSTWGSDSSTTKPSDNTWGSDSTNSKPSDNAWGSESSTNKPSDNAWGSDSASDKPPDNTWGTESTSDNTTEPWGSRNNNQTEPVNSGSWGNNVETQEKPSSWGSESIRPSSNETSKHLVDNSSTNINKNDSWNRSRTKSSGPRDSSNNFNSQNRPSFENREKKSWGDDNMPTPNNQASSWGSDHRKESVSSWDSAPAPKNGSTNSWNTKRSSNPQTFSGMSEPEPHNTIDKPGNSWGDPSANSQVSSAPWGDDSSSKQDTQDSWNSDVKPSQNTSSSNGWGSGVSSNNSFGGGMGDNAVPQTPISTWDGGIAPEHDQGGIRNRVENMSFDDANGDRGNSWGNNSFKESRGRSDFSSYEDSRGRGGHSSYGGSRGRGGYSSYGDGRGRGGQSSYGDSRGRGNWRGRGRGNGEHNNEGRFNGNRGNHDGDGGRYRGARSGGYQDRQYSSNDGIRGGDSRNYGLPQTPGIQGNGFGSGNDPEISADTGSFGSWGEPKQNNETPAGSGWGQNSEDGGSGQSGNSWA
ncbi:Transcription elongation factor spt5 [Smittium mucronatum]|uniref:Chromatin elongation factor SPT5 n=1 Tax=Smittium mucronatum TaxID=133383 RepID=A0A1R0GVV3_9FUNG|nr:Transcription elongation factor spt5 [Smittium mucronatum]